MRNFTFSPHLLLYGFPLHVGERHVGICVLSSRRALEDVEDAPVQVHLKGFFVGRGQDPQVLPF